MTEQKREKALPYAQIVNHFLKKGGAISEITQTQKTLATVYQEIMLQSTDPKKLNNEGPMENV